LDQAREATHRQPFRPFTLYLVDGQSYRGRHPDFVAVLMSHRGKDLTVYDGDGSRMVDMGLIVEMRGPDAARPAHREGS
jgi:hypothetical protein